MIGINAGCGKAKAIDGTAVDKMLSDDLFGVACMSEAVPDGFWVDDEDSGVLALIEAAGFVDADPMLETGRFDGVLERASKFLAVFVGATGAGGGLVPFIHADKEMVIVDRHDDVLMRKGT